MGLSFPLVSDWPKFRGTRAFGVLDDERGWTHRVTFVIDKTGVISHVVDDPDNMTRHPTEALAAVRALGSAGGNPTAPNP